MGVQTSGSKYATNLASRTAVGYDAQGRLIIVQVDGSIAVGDNKRGMDMKEVANLLIQHGAVEAINLDGGGSSAMAHGGVLVNYPSDNRPPSCDKSGLFQCERPVSTVLCIHEQEGLASGSSGPFDGMSAGMYLAAGSLIFAIGALGSMCFIRYGNLGDGFERQLNIFRNGMTVTATCGVWENEIMDTDTWVEFVKKHKFSDFLEKQNLDENDLMIDVLLR